MFTIRTAIAKLIRHQDLSADEIQTILWEILSGSVTPMQLGGFLVAMRMKGETVDELVATVNVLKKLTKPIAIEWPNLIDIVGTGRDHIKTFNISTCSAIVVAAAGGYVAKSGSRPLTGSSGSADVLERAGIVLNVTPAQIAESIKKIGVGFVYATQHHIQLREAANLQKELGIRTLFNLLIPLLNPVPVKHQLIGVFAQNWLKPMAEVLQRLGSQHVLVVYAEDGLDEISTHAPTHIAELKDNHIHTYMITPEQFGIARTDIANLRVKNPEQSLEIILQVLQNKPGPARDIVVLNAGAAIYVAGLTEDLSGGIKKAQEVLENGFAYQKFKLLQNSLSLAEER